MNNYDTNLCYWELTGRALLVECRQLTYFQRGQPTESHFLPSRASSLPALINNLVSLHKFLSMSWKKTPPFFAWQAFKYAKNWAHFKKIWSFYGQWLSSFRHGRTSVSDEWAWITFPALNYLELNLQPEYRVFEFGGGGSTLFFCKRVAEVVTVEDNSEWFKTLTEMVHNKNYQHWTGYHVPPEKIPGMENKDFHNPGNFKSGSKSLDSMSFERYARSIDIFPEHHFDVVLVDGRARPSCIQQALPHLKTGGLLVIDNTERPYYLAPFKELFDQKFEVVLNMRAPVPYTPDFTRTTILRKIEDF